MWKDKVYLRYFVYSHDVLATGYPTGEPCSCKVFTSDSFGIGLRLFLERFVGRYLQFFADDVGDTSSLSSHSYLLSVNLTPLPIAPCCRVLNQTCPYASRLICALPLTNVDRIRLQRPGTKHQLPAFVATA